MMCAAYIRILLSEDVPFTNRRCYTPRFREETWSTIRGSVGCCCDSASLERERLLASSQLVAHTLACMRAARHAMMDLRAGATSRQTSIMARAQLYLELHCLIPPWCKGGEIHRMCAAYTNGYSSPRTYPSQTVVALTPRIREETWSTIRGSVGCDSASEPRK